MKQRYQVINYSRSLSIILVEAMMHYYKFEEIAFRVQLQWPINKLK